MAKGFCQSPNIGAIGSKGISSAMTLANNTHADIVSVTLDPGVYLFIGTIRYLSNATGFRKISIHPTSQWNGTECEYVAVSGDKTICNLTKMVAINTSSTIYLIGYQNSGGNLNIDVGQLEYFKLADKA